MEWVEGGAEQIRKFSSSGLKIVTYNINGLRSRVSQHNSLLKLLDSLDADIICFQVWTLDHPRNAQAVLHY